MKKFISLLIASAMVVSLVPATAFAGQDVSATAKVVGAETIAEGEDVDDTPELQITIASASYSGSDASFDNDALNVADPSLVGAPEIDMEIVLDEVDFDGSYSISSISFEADDEENGAPAVIGNFECEDEELTFTIYGKVFEDDVIVIQLDAKSDDVEDLGAGDYATVSVDSDIVEVDDLVFITCADMGVEASIQDLTYIAEDEIASLDETLKIEESVTGTFAAAEYMILEISKGFEFSDNYDSVTSGVSITQPPSLDDNELYVDGFQSLDEIKIDGLEIIVDSASEGDIATIEITLYDDNDKKICDTEVEVVEVCEYTVVISVDEDEDVPVIYSGVNSDNYGINDDSDHESLEVTITESFPGAWSNRDEFELTLPEGVYVVDVEVDSDNWDAYGTTTAINEEEAFAEAYYEGGYESFVFEKRLFEETTGGSEIEITFTLVLTAEQDFVGDVVLGFVGDSVTEDEVVIAEFVSSYEVTAEQNDVIIDYRNTPIDTPVVITEAEAELWNDDMEFFLSMESDYMSFDDEGDVTVNSDSDMTVDVNSSSTYAWVSVTVDDESEDEAGVLTWEGLELYMSRDLAAGAYALDITTSANQMFLNEAIFGGVDYAGGDYNGDDDYACVGHVADDVDSEYDSTSDKYSTSEDNTTVEVQAAFVNIVTAGSDQANTFTTQVIVPIGEYYIYAGGTQIALDAPAYISDAGYTMLPVRAVASALGIDTSAVVWNSEARQVVITYGSKIVAMTIGESYMSVNGTLIATSAAPEIVDSRTFLPLRDLATALSVSITWDDTTKTATLN
ncbi:copper amine oxidase N-terminal domain-containing protein [Chakrabartyella piscis]|uniref:copper amine oxidase N-terminal domain-containing protein n=1 Tax=Chakrabartyella piscis TaxID=2918914 RepID=UPI002958769E|nr:copper amine oxidase N-terminal domain-containing protein [Chakrabartyella piscis]